MYIGCCNQTRVSFAPVSSSANECFFLCPTDAESTEELIQVGEKSSVDGWHIIQFSGGKKAPTKFNLCLFWSNNGTRTTSDDSRRIKKKLVLKLRTDVDKLTPETETVLQRLPEWCSLFGKSTSPHTLAFLNRLSM